MLTLPIYTVALPSMPQCSALVWQFPIMSLLPLTFQKYIHYKCTHRKEVHHLPFCWYFNHHGLVHPILISAYPVISISIPRSDHPRGLVDNPFTCPMARSSSHHPHICPSHVYSFPWKFRNILQPTNILLILYQLCIYPGFSVDCNPRYFDNTLLPSLLRHNTKHKRGDHYMDAHPNRNFLP